MATLNFTRAHSFSINGGIYSDAQHVTMISNSVDTPGVTKDHLRPGKNPRGFRRRRPRTPSPSLSESSFVSSNNSGQSRRSTPPTSADEHESPTSQTATSDEQLDPLSPLSSRLGEMTGLTALVRLQTSVTSPRTVFPPMNPSSITIRPVRPSHNEPTASARTSPVSPRLDRRPGRESFAYVGNQIRPRGPRHRPLPPTPRSQAVHPGTAAELSSTTGSPSHVPGSSSSQSSWGSLLRDLPRVAVRSPTAPPRPTQPIPLSRRGVRADVSAPSPSSATRNSFASCSSLSRNRSSPSPVFLTSPIQGSFTDSMTSPSRRSVQSPLPNFPFHSLPLPSPSVHSRTPSTIHSLLSPTRHIPSQSIPFPPQSTPPQVHTTSSYTSSRASGQIFRPLPVGHLYQSSAWSTDYPEIDTSPHISYYYHTQTQNQSNQEFTHTSSSGTPEQILSQGPYFADGVSYLPQTQPSYSIPTQLQQSSNEHPYHYYTFPSRSPH